MKKDDKKPHRYLNIRTDVIKTFIKYHLSCSIFVVPRTINIILVCDIHFYHLLSLVFTIKIQHIHLSLKLILFGTFNNKVQGCINILCRIAKVVSYHFKSYLTNSQISFKMSNLNLSNFLMLNIWHFFLSLCFEAIVFVLSSLPCFLAIKDLCTVFLCCCQFILFVIPSFL